MGTLFRRGTVRELALKYQEAGQKVQEAEAAQERTKKAIEALDNMIASTRSFLGKDIAILSDNSDVLILRMQTADSWRKQRHPKMNYRWRRKSIGQNVVLLKQI